MRLDLRGKVVLITGGSRGLGLVMARQLVVQGARVAVCARDPDELARAQQELPELVTVTCDLTDADQLDRLIAEVTAQLGPIDCLINNAGVIQVGPMQHMTIDDYERAMATHFWAPLRLALAVLPRMRERGEGRIVNIASIGGKIAVPHLLPYTASKFALVGLSEGMRAEVAKDRVYVTTVIPGLMRTGSPINAQFKGRNEAEYAWFAAGDSSHLTAMQAERAARQIITAMRHGRPEITLTNQAKLAVRLFALAPSLMQRALAVVDRLLPKAGGIEEATALGSESRRGPSLLTRASDRAAIRNNEL
jgi:short-subunit dehydrogenase